MALNGLLAHNREGMPASGIEKRVSSLASRKDATATWSPRWFRPVTFAPTPGAERHVPATIAVAPHRASGERSPRVGRDGYPASAVVTNRTVTHRWIGPLTHDDSA